MFDMSRCPQTESEAADWFYKGIGCMMGQNASDWEAIMTACGLPPGYGPGVVPNASMPYFAFTQQFSGGPKGRIFLPTATPDGLGYYTRCIQYLDDAAQTYSKMKDPRSAQFDAKSGGLVWAWYWVAGNEYAPVVGAEGGGTQPPVSSGMTQEEVQAMIDAAVKPLQEQIANAVKLQDKIALRTNSGKIMGIEGGGPSEENVKIVLISKTDIHSWESFTLERGE